MRSFFIILLLYVSANIVSCVSTEVSNEVDILSKTSNNGAVIEVIITSEESLIEVGLSVEQARKGVDLLLTEVVEMAMSVFPQVDHIDSILSDDDAMLIVKVIELARKGLIYEKRVKTESGWCTTERYHVSEGDLKPRLSK